MPNDLPSQPEVSAAQLEHERLLSLINSMADGVIAVDEQAKIALYNAAAMNILDLNTNIQGLSIRKVLQPINQNGELVQIDTEILATKIPTVNRDYRLPYSDGSTINLYLNISPVRQGFGKTGSDGFVIIMRDITREKSLEEERDEFISVVSHELRTPIAIAEGNISNAQYAFNKGSDGSIAKVALEQAHNQVLFLADMINDLSTLSRAERGVLTIEPEPINIHDLVTELGSNYLEQAKQKNLKLQIKLSPHLEILHSSKLYVREVLQNFITNALKYTEKGSVTIGARPGKDGVVFTVTDTGIGISKSDQDRVFDKFFRSEDFRTRQNSGTGLGLYVTMKLARLLHANIDLSSELNHGSTFTIVIPNITVHSSKNKK